VARRSRDGSVFALGLGVLVIVVLVAGALSTILQPVVGDTIASLVGVVVFLGSFVAMGYTWYKGSRSALLSPPARTQGGFIAKRPSRRAYRQSIPRGVRNLVFLRDGGHCQLCGAVHNLEIAHIIPLSRGGSNTPQNLQVLCATCNRRKGNRYVG
jgi:hypothetical protein